MPTEAFNIEAIRSSAARFLGGMPLSLRTEGVCVAKKGIPLIRPSRVPLRLFRLKSLKIGFWSLFSGVIAVEQSGDLCELVHRRGCTLGLKSRGGGLQRLGELINIDA